MPFKSEAQRRYMWATDPEMARRWAHEHPGQKNLPYHVRDRKKKKPMTEEEKDAGLAESIAALRSSTKVTSAMNTIRQPVLGGTAMPTPIRPPAQAYAAGQQQAMQNFGLKQAGMLSGGVGMLGRGLKWGGRMAANVPIAGNALGAVAGGVGGMMQGAANGEGFKGMAARGAAGAATGAIPGPGLSMAAGYASDKMLDAAMAPKAPSIQ